MPHPESSEGRAILYAQSSLGTENRAVEAAREEVRKLIFQPSELLCSACRALARLGYDFDENPALSRWWEEHKKEDEKR